MLCTCVGGRQFKITSNDLIVINRIQADIGEQIYLEKVGDMLPVEHFGGLDISIFGEDVVEVYISQIHKRIGCTSKPRE